MKSKQILSLLLALCLFAGMLPIPAMAEEATEPVNSGTCGKNTTWEFHDGVLTISGTGEMKDYGILFPGPWKSFAESIVTVVIEDGVTYIGDYAFSQYAQLQNVIIGSGVTHIGSNAFSHCDKLNDVVIPGNVQLLDKYAFGYCEGLSALTIREGVSTIGGSAFSGCTALEHVTLPNTVTSMGTYAFSSCTSLKSVTLSENLTEISNYAFYKCAALTSVVIPDSVTRLGAQAFMHCGSLTDVILSKNLREIDEAAFRECTALGYIKLPESLERIGEWAFFDCSSLDRIVIPQNVQRIEDYAFLSCSGMKDLYFTENPVEGEGLTHIGKQAFQNCSSLNPETVLTIPDSVTYLGVSAFRNCSALTNVILSKNLTAISNSTFYKCTALEEIKIPDSVTSIGDTAFWHCTKLSYAYIGKGVKEIGHQAFTDAGEDLDIPFWFVFSGDAPEIEKQAFIGVYGLAHYFGLNETWTEDKLQDYGGDIIWQGIYARSWVENLTLSRAVESNIRITAFNIKDGPASGNKLRGVMIDSIEGYRDLDGIESSEDYVFYSNTISNLSAGMQDVILSKKDYRDYVIPAEVGGTLWGSNGKPYELTALMTKFTWANKKDPYISTVFGRNNGAGEDYVELRSNRLVVSPTVTQDVIISAVGFEGQNVTYYMGIRGGDKKEKCISSKDGIFHGTYLYYLMNDKNTVYIWAESETTGKKTDWVTVYLTKSAANNALEENLKKGSISLLGEDGFKITLGGNSDLFGGLELDTDDFEVPVGVYISGDQMKVSFGIDIFDNDDTPSEAQSNLEKLKNAIYKKGDRREKAEKAISSYDQWLKEMDTLSDKCGKGPFKVKNVPAKSFEFKIGVMGYAELQLVNGQWIVTEGVMGVDGEIKLKHGVQTYVYWVPVNGGIEGGAEVELTGHATRGVPEKGYPFKFSFILDVTPEITLDAGIGLRDAASGGLYGSGSLPITMVFTERHLTIKAKGEIGAKAEFFGTESKKVLLESKEITLLDHRFGSNATAMVFDDAPEQTVTTVMDRDYADHTSAWLRSPQQLQNAAAHATSSVAARGVSFLDLQTSIFSDSQPQLVTLGDRMVLVWAEDCAQRDIYNRMRLVFSVYDPATDTWSDPSPVWDDGKNDGYARIAGDGENVWVLWQKVNALRTEENVTDIAFALANTELCLARFDAASGTFTDAQMITANSEYEYAHRIYLSNGTPRVIWASAPENALNASGVHRITGWAGGLTETLADGLNYILTIDATEGEVTYVTDSDSDPSTTADITAFTVTAAGTVAYDNSETDRAVTYAAYGRINGQETLFLSDMTNVYCLQDGLWQAVFSGQRSMSGNLQIVETPLGTTLLWTENTQGWNELYSVRFQDGSWSDPVQISENGQLLSAVSAVCHKGQLAGVCNANTVTLDESTGEYRLAETDLRFFRANDFTDIILDSALPLDADALWGSTEATIYAAVYNRGTVNVDSITFTVTDTLGTDVTQTVPVNLPSGSSQVVELTYPVPENYACTTVTVTAQTTGTDIDPKDNVFTLDIGAYDLALADVSLELLAEDYLLKATVENRSLADAEDVVLEVRQGSENGALLSMETIGALARENYALVSIALPIDSLTFGETGAATLYLILRSAAEDAVAENNVTCILVEKVTRESSASPDELSGQSGDTQWTLTGEGILTVSGQGSMADYDEQNSPPWAEYADMITEVVIEAGVSRLGAAAFRDMSNPITVTFRGSAPEIAANAFENTTAACRYPELDATWTEAMKSGYGGNLEWIGYDICGGIHTEVVDAAKDPTCTETGLTAGAHCEVCGKILSSQGEIPALGHDFVDFICTRCGERDPNAPAIMITSQPVDYVGLVGDTATFTVVAEGEGLTYQWYYFEAASSTWQKSSGGTAATLNVDFVAYRNNQQYRCEITDADGNSVITNTVKLTAKVVDLVIVTQPVSTTGSVNQELSFTVEASGNGLTYQWYYSDNGGSTWKISGTPGFNTKTLLPILRDYRDGYKYYCQISDVFGNSVKTEVVSMVVKSSPVTIITQPVDVDMGILNQLHTFQVTATGENLDYRWEYSDDGGETWQLSWNEGYASPTLTVRLYSYRDGYLYRCKVVSGLKNTVYTNAVELNLQAPSAAIVKQPTNVAVVSGKNIQFHVEATGNELTYQWYRSNDDGLTWVKTWMGGYNTDTLYFAANASRAALYKCQVTDGSGKEIWTNPVKLRILSAELKILSQPENVTCANGATATFHVEAQGDNLKYQWYASSDGVTWSKTYLDGSTTDTLSFSVTAARAAKVYKCVITDIGGNTVETGAVSVSVG